jgi:hypothetical protein
MGISIQGSKDVRKAIYFNDIVGSSKLWKAHPEGMFKALSKFLQVANKTIKRHKDGRILRFMGDSLLIDFTSEFRAIEFALDLQAAIRANPIQIHGDEVLQVRSGIAYGRLKKVALNLGGCQSVDYYGNVINTASRMESKVSPVGGLAVAVISKRRGEIKKIVDMVQQRRGQLFKVASVIEFAESAKCVVPASQLRNTILCQDSSVLHGVEPTIAIKISPLPSGPRTPLPQRSRLPSRTRAPSAGDTRLD